MRIIKCLALFSIALPALGWADFHCQSAISFKWKRGDAEFDVYRQVVTGAGVDEAEAKAKLKDAVDAAKTEAQANCKQQHENLAGCIAAKFQTLGNTYQALGFSARKTMEEAITKDCENQQGLCAGAHSSDPACVQRFASGEPSPTPEEAKKDEKGKGKKK